MYQEVHQKTTHTNVAKKKKDISHGVAYDDHDRRRRKATDQRGPQPIHDVLVQLLNVGAEPVEDAPKRGLFEPPHRSTHDPRGHGVVHASGCLERRQALEECPSCVQQQAVGRWHVHGRGSKEGRGGGKPCSACLTSPPLSADPHSELWISRA